YAYLYAYGVYPTNAYGSQIQHRVNIATGDVNAVVTEGSWRPYIIRIYWYNAIPTEYLYTRMDLYDYTTAYEPIAVAAGATATRNLAYKTGSVTATFRVEGGGLLSNPRLVGWCHEYDELDQLLWSYYVDSWNYAQVNVEVGTVTFVGLDGTCDIAAEAEVGGSRTIFGRPAIQAIAGAQQGVDIGGPSLTVEFPEPDYISETSIVTVTGTATDDVQVSSVTVNGITAALTSTDNPDDPNEVSFSVDIVLAAKGPNEVVTVATDTSGKTATDTRTVYWDEYPPHLSWKPDDGTITSESVITVEGKATNDAEVASVTVNGVEVTLTPTGNPNDPLEVSFSTTVNLVEGANNITVVATDISTRTITQTHTVTYVVNNPPVAVDDFAETGEDTPVTIEVLSNDSDLDGDPLSVNIFGPAAHGAVTVNEDNTVTYEPEPGFSGMDSFTYTVSDWADDSNVALVTITVVPAPEPVVTEEILVELHTIDQSTRGGATVTPVEGAQVRVYDRDNEDFRGAYGGKNPKGALYPIIFDADFGLVATCATGPDGRATCEEDAPGQYLVLVGVVDGSDTVIVGKPKSLEESVGADGDGIADPITHMGNCFGPIDPNTGLPAPLLDTNGDWTDTDCDGVLDTGATKEFPVVKVIKKNGEKQIGHGSKRVVKGN
ncbi:MAG: Ig-like domain-containing protein, partial [SAR202 cluster bacterium]|nr:Ig-like domain-containing protein [SAR202 cluster bacterium]